MLTIKDLLDIQSIKGLKIVAGEKGIHNVISLVNIMENPDAFDWLSSNELLLSTGYIFKDNPELQNRIIKELAEINCSGLVVKMKRYFDAIPQNMIDQANKYNLPLLELPFGYTLSKVISIINEKASGRYDLLNRKTLDMHNTLFRIALEGGGIERISTSLAETVNNPIIVLDSEWRALHYTEHSGNKIPLEYALDFSANRAAFCQEFIDSIPSDISEMKKLIMRIYHLDGMKIKCRILPVGVSQSVYGYIVVWQTVRELTEFDYIVIEQASTIMALEMIKVKEIENVKLKIRQDFFDDLLTGSITSKETLHTLCELHGLHTDYIYYCTVIDIESHDIELYKDMVERKYQLESKAKRCVEVIYENSSNLSGRITSFYRNNRVIILNGQNKKKPAISVSEAKKYAEDLLTVLEKQIPNTKFLLGIGSQFPSITMLHKSFSEAQEAIHLMERFQDKGAITHFEDYAVYHFLESNVKEIQLEDFFMKTLGKLYENDKLHQTNYLFTLENYFYNNLNLSETAKAMFLHRNTLIYRIEKMKEILNSNLKNPDELLQIQLALKIYRLLNQKLQQKY